MSGVGITVQGWSSAQGNDLDLTEIDVNIKSKEECDHKYESVSKEYYDYYLPEKLKKVQFCAGNVDENVRTFYGDSGGPAFIRRWSVTGKMDDGRQCNKSKYLPDV